MRKTPVSKTPVSKELAAVQTRVATLRERADDSRHGLLPDAFEELHTTLEELRVAEEEMRAQNEELLLTRHRVEAERLRYQDLFESAPDGYLVTTLDGKILEANRAASLLLNIAPRFLKNRPLAGSVYEQDLREFHTRMAALIGAHKNGQAAGPQEWTLRLRRRQVGPFYAALTIAPVASQQGEPAILRWMLRDITERRRAEQERLELAQRQAGYERDRRIAETLQRALLRTVPPDAFPHLSIETFYEAALEEAQVGGDFFDVFTLEQGRVALVVGDVSGKGLAAAEMTGQVKYALRVFLRQSSQPALALTQLNDFLCEAQHQGDAGSDHLVALTLAVVTPETGEAVLATAGNEPPLARRANGVWETLPLEGVLLGVQPGMLYDEQRTQLFVGDTLLIVTDGITEARQGNELLGADGLRRMAEDLRESETLHGMGRALLDGARAYAGGSLQDDACLLLARRR